MTGARRALPKRLLSPAALLACSLAAAAPASAASIAGRLGSPTDYVPALTVHAWSEATGKLASVATAPGQASYRLALPPGRYLVFATPADPGAPPVYGAHTRFTLCARDARRLEAGACDDHGLVEVEVGRRGVEGVDISDWYLDDATVARIDRVLGRRGESWTEATLAAPKFSEYPATANPVPPAVASAPVAAAGTAGPPTRDARAANFAGGWLLERSPCPATPAAGTPPAGAASAAPGTRGTAGAASPAGEACESVSLTELSTGRVHRPEALAALPAAEPCAGVKVLQFRRDSRLLTVTTAQDDALVTRYLVWNPATATLRAVATLSSPVAERCGG